MSSRGAGSASDRSAGSATSRSAGSASAHGAGGGGLWLRAALPPAVIVIAVLLLWEAVVLLFKPAPFIFPGPLDVAGALADSARPLAAATLRTASSAILGFVISGILGVALGSVIASSRFLERGVYPLATLLQMVPLVAIAPLLVIWCGYGLGATVASAVIVALFPVLANTLDGLRSVDPGLREIFAIYRAPRLITWWKLGLPAATPGIITGLRIAAGLSVIGTIVGEFVASYAGEDAPLGVVIMAAMRESKTSLVFAAVLLSALVGFLLFGIVSAVGWATLRRWHSSGV